MNRKNLYLFAGILTLFVFIGFLSETDSQELFGYPISVWVFRGAYLLLTISFFTKYFEMKKAEKQ